MFIGIKELSCMPQTIVAPNLILLGILFLTGCWYQLQMYSVEAVHQEVPSWGVDALSTDISGLPVFVFV